MFTLVVILLVLAAFGGGIAVNPLLFLILVLALVVFAVDTRRGGRLP